MARYILAKDFVQIKESSGTIFNISNVKVEISDTARACTGVILYPSRKMNFSNRLYAARAPSDCGVAVIGVLAGANIDDDTISDTEIEKIFDEETDNPSQPADDETITDEDLQKIFRGEHVFQDTDDMDADWQQIFGR